MWRLGPIFSSPTAVPLTVPRNTIPDRRRARRPPSLRRVLRVPMSNPPTHGSRVGPSPGARILRQLGHLPPDFEEARSFASRRHRRFVRLGTDPVVFFRVPVSVAP